MTTIYNDGEYYCEVSEREILEVIANVKIECENDTREFEDIILDLETENINELVEKYHEDLIYAFEEIADYQNACYKEDNERLCQATWERWGKLWFLE